MLRRSSRWVAGLAAVLALAQVGLAHEDDLVDRLENTKEQLEDRKHDLDAVRDELATITDKVREADAQLAQLNGELTTLEARLAEAQAALEAARARTADATAELQVISTRLEDTRQRLDAREQTFDDRVAAAYKYGNVAYAEALIGTKDIADFLNTAYYIRSVMSADQFVIHEVADATRSLVEDRARADELREEMAHEQRQAADRQAEVERLTESQRKLTDLVETERARRKELMDKLVVEEAATEDEIAELEAESEKLAEELRKSRWRAGRPGVGTWVWPSSGQVGSGYGYRVHPIYGYRRMHTGVDISGSFGQPIVAANDGLVIAAYCTGGGYGCRVVIDHGGGMGSLYAHQSKFAVREGQVVGAGQVIGYVGSTGASTGPHLHFEIRINGAPVDPMQYF